MSARLSCIPECIKQLLPNIAAAGLWESLTDVTAGTALAGTAAAGVTIAGLPIAPFIVPACILGMIGLSAKKKLDEKQSQAVLDILRKRSANALKELEQLGIQSKAGHEGTQARIIDSTDKLFARLDEVEQNLLALHKADIADQTKVLALLDKHEGFYVSLAGFLEENHAELVGKLDAIPAKLNELVAGNNQIWITLASLQKDYERLAIRLDKKYEHERSQMQGRINDLTLHREDQAGRIREQTKLLELNQEQLAERERQIQELESTLRDMQAQADTGNAQAQAAIDAIRATGDLVPLRDTKKRLAHERRTKERETEKHRQAIFIEECLEIALISETLGDIPDAIDQYKAALQEDPMNPFATNRLGHLYQLTGELDLAVACYEKLPTLRPGDQTWLSASYGNLGLIYKTRGELDKAEQMHRKSLEINERLGQQEGMAIAYGNLGLIYRTRGELDKAEQMHRKSLEIEERLGRQEGMASEYSNLGLIYQTRSELDKAEQMFLKSLEIDERLGRQEGMATEYGNLGMIYGTRGELDKAEQMFLKALKIDQRLGRQKGMANQYGNLGLIYQTRGELNKAEQMHHKSLKIDERLGRKEGMATTYSNLSMIYKTRGDFKTARECWEKSLALFEKIGIPDRIDLIRGWLDELPPSE